MAEDNLSTKAPAEVLASVRRKGVKLWAEGDRLRFQSPKGALTEEEIAEIRMFKADILSLLQASVAERAPLSFSQMSHWNTHRLWQRPSMRVITAAIELRGSLDIGALARSVDRVVRRHDALRTRIVRIDGIPMQDVHSFAEGTLRLDYLSRVPTEDRAAALTRAIHALILEPVDVCADPLFAARLIEMDDEVHVLVLAMEHLISDMTSLALLQREVLQAYDETVSGRADELSREPMQFPEFALAQRRAHEQWIAEHGAYWARFAGRPRARFRDDPAATAAHASGWETVSFRIDSPLRAGLMERSRQRATTLPMLAFSAYAVVALHWCETSDSIVRYQSEGRFTHQVAHTIGFFASALNVHVELRDQDTFVGLLRRITARYCEAYEHADGGYLTAQTPRPDFSRNTVFNWIPAGGADLGALSPGAGLQVRKMPFPHPMAEHLDMDIEPNLVLFDTGQEIAGEVYFPRSRFTAASMNRFADHLLAVLRAMRASPEGLVREVVLA